MCRFIGARRRRGGFHGRTYKRMETSIRRSVRGVVGRIRSDHGVGDDERTLLANIAIATAIVLVVLI